MYILRLSVAAATLIASAHALMDNSSLNSQVRCAFHGDDSLTISWNTLDQLKNPVVHYGLTPIFLNKRSSHGESTTFPTSSTWDNTVTLRGLRPDTTYYYAPEHLIRDHKKADWPPFECKTSRPAGNWKPYTVAFLADMGAFGKYGLSDHSGTGVDPNSILKPGEHTTIQSMRSQAHSYDFILHGGDFAYADAWMAEESEGYIPNTGNENGYKVYNTILNAFWDQLMALTSRKPYMVAVGNHEANCDGGKGVGVSVCPEGQRNFTGYLNHWNMPADVSGGYEDLWYSFDYGSVHYLVFNTETNLGNGLTGPDEPPNANMAGPFGVANDQIDFINKDLANVDRCKTPWVVAMGHRPWFTTGPCKNCSVAFAPVFEKYNVDLVLQGHYHVYQRNVPVYANGTIDPAGYNNPSTPFYVINGIAGHYDGMDYFDGIEPYQAFGLDTNNATYGWSRVRFHNETTLSHEFVASNNNSVIDRNYLYKKRKSCGRHHY